jgi:hypothetical protein
MHLHLVFNSSSFDFICCRLLLQSIEVHWEPYVKLAHALGLLCRFFWEFPPTMIHIGEVLLHFVSMNFVIHLLYLTCICRHFLCDRVMTINSSKSCENLKVYILALGK